MSAATITLDTRAFERELGKMLDRSKKSAPEVVKQQAKLFVRDVVRMTPPMTDGKRPTQESLNEQKRAGEKAVVRDIGRVFTTATGLTVSKAQSGTFSESELVNAFDFRSQELSDRVVNLARKGDVSAIRELVKDSKLPLFGVAAAPDPAMHNRQRKRGKVSSRRTQRFLITSAPSVRAYVRQRLKEVGKAKAGWARAAATLGVNLPNWIAGKASPGLCDVSSLNNPTKPSLTVGNLVDYIQATGARLRIIQRAIDFRAGAMRAQAERAAAAAMKG